MVLSGIFRENAPFLFRFLAQLQVTGVILKSPVCYGCDGPCGPRISCSSSGWLVGLGLGSVLQDRGSHAPGTVTVLRLMKNLKVFRQPGKLSVEPDELVHMGIEPHDTLTHLQGQRGKRRLIQCPLRASACGALPCSMARCCSDVGQDSRWFSKQRNHCSHLHLKAQEWVLVYRPSAHIQSGIQKRKKLVKHLYISWLPTQCMDFCFQ